MKLSYASAATLKAIARQLIEEADAVLCKGAIGCQNLKDGLDHRAHCGAAILWVSEDGGHDRVFEGSAFVIT